MCGFNVHCLVTRNAVLLVLTMVFLSGCASTEEESQGVERFASLASQVANSNSQVSRPASKKYQGVRSILVSQNGELVYEKYFNDGKANKPVHMASLGKSILSAMIGIAIDKGLINSVEESVYQYFPYKKYDNWNTGKPDLKIRHLLAMSSGWKCGSMANPRNHCGVKMQNHKDKLKWLLDLPMEAKPGAIFNYSDAIPHVLVTIQAQATNMHPAEFFRQHLQLPMGLQHNPYEKNQLTSRDMLKIGQLFLNKGQWQGQQLISESWVEESTASVFKFKKSAGGYGYLWWQQTFKVDDVEYHSYYAGGNGGQYIFVIPQLDLVTVFTGSHYGNMRLLGQPVKIMQKHILPALLVSPNG